MKTDNTVIGKVGQMIVTLIDHMGSDLSVVNAARVSFAKVHEAFDENKDTKLINYLAKHDHWSPFGHGSLQFHISAPVFVARQLVKHQVGLVWNEVSRRYVDSDPEFYIPEIWRGAPENKKQGSSDIAIDIDPNDFMQMMASAKWMYKHLLELGVCPEQARMVLPQAMMTEWYWSGTLYAFARVCNLRCKDDAQFETQMVAKQINKFAGERFPVSWKALRNG